MLILTRKIGETVVIGPDVAVTVVDVDGAGKVRLGVVAPPDVKILREELLAQAPPRVGVTPKAEG